MTARFTRDQHNRWLIATPSPADANARIMVDRKGREPIPMATGEYVGPKTMRDGTVWHTYTIDRKRGGKAPTSGRLGENATKTKGRETRDMNGNGLGDYEYDTETQETTEVETETATATVDLSEYAKVSYVDGLARTLHARIDMAQQEQRVTIDIREADHGELRTVEGITHKVLPDVLACLAAGVHVYLVGPAGSGKTHLSSSAADALGRELSICGAMLTKHEVTGFMNANGGYVTTAAREAYEHGHVLLWDEVDASMPAALVAVNAMLANGEYTFPDRTVKRHPNFVCIAAGNTYGRGADREYVGRLQLDAATLDRFAIIDVDYDLGLERALARAEYKAHGGTDAGQLESWCDKVLNARDKASEGGIRHVISPRASIAGAKLLARGLDVERVTEMVLRKGIDADAARLLGVA